MFCLCPNDRKIVIKSLRGAGIQRRRGNLVWDCYDWRLERFQRDCFVTMVNVPRNDDGIASLRSQ